MTTCKTCIWFVPEVPGGKPEPWWRVMFFYAVDGARIGLECHINPPTSVRGWPVVLPDDRACACHCDVAKRDAAYNK
jgi:hypothetical protein